MMLLNVRKQNKRRKTRGDREGEEGIDDKQGFSTEEIEKQLMILNKVQATREDKIPSESHVSS